MTDKSPKKDYNTLVAMTPMQMALIVDAAKKHVLDVKSRVAVYQVGINKELFARLLEACGKKKTDLFINTIVEIGLLNWREAMIGQVFGGEEKYVEELVSQASKDMREGETVQ